MPRRCDMASHAPLILTLTMIAAAAFPAAAFAQFDAAPMVQVRITQVKPEMVVEYRELQEKYSKALKKAGLSSKHVWTSGRAGTIAEYYIVTPFTKFAEFDDWPYSIGRTMGPGPAAAWVARARRCILSSSQMILQRIDEATIPMKEGRKPVLALAELRKTAPGTRHTYEEYLETEYVPLLKKAGVDGFYVFRMRHGGSPRDIVTLRLFDKWAELDQPNPLAKILGPEKTTELNRKGGRTLVGREKIILRYRDELSFTNP